MLKALYLITFLSVVLFNSEASFGQAQKKELGVCGKTFSAILKFTKPSEPEITVAVMNEEEFCDYGRYEQSANFLITLYNAKDQVVYDKYVYLNPLTFHEGQGAKGSGKFTKTKIKDNANSRIVKFPVKEDMGAITKYKIQSLSDKKTYETKVIKW